jgi:ammonia channel protein AmtB
MWAVDPQLLDLIAATDAAWTYLTCFLVFFMQAGFALLEAGAVGSKDIISILLKVSGAAAQLAAQPACTWIECADFTD